MESLKRATIRLRSSGMIFIRVRREVVRQETRAGTKVVERKRSGQFKLQNADFEHVPGLGAFDVYRSSQKVRAWTPVGHLFISGSQRIRNLIVWNAGRLQARWVARHGFDSHRIGGVDGQHGLGLRGVVSPDNILGRGFQLKVFGTAPWSAANNTEE